jgi:vacuolar protein sorting-associated protein 33A
LSLLLPNPAPASIASAVTKYPYVGLRKSLRLLIDDNPESLEEVENDISFTYSGYAPISIRLVQCVAQKGGVLSNPAEKERVSPQGNGKEVSSPGNKVQAHPIVGWKGFEDVLALIPGQTFDHIQHGIDAKPASSMSRGTFFCVINLCNAYILSGSSRGKTTTTVVFFLGGCTYTEIAALRWVSRQNQGTLVVLFSRLTNQ